jgi:cell division protein FtsX
VIRFGLRLALAGGREAAIRLATIAAAVAIGVAMLLATIAGLHAVTSQSDREAWLNTRSTPAVAGVDPVMWNLNGDFYAGQEIARLDVAATGANSPVPPGIPALPGPGEFYASPAMTRLLATVPADELGDRFPGHQIGTIGAAALPGPDSLVIMIGRTPAEMSGAEKVYHIADTSPGDCSDCYIGVRAAGYQLILGVVIAALLFPVLIFIGAATRLTAARREQRFAAMRLLGATPRQVETIAAAESTAAAVIGTALGFLLFVLLRGPIASVPFTAYAFYRSDLTFGPLAIGVVALGVPVGAAIAARLALRRVRISPLGVARRTTPKPPGAWRLVPAPVGLLFLGYFVVFGRPEGSLNQLAVFLPGILVVMAGLVLAGPWFTMVGARTLARRSSRPATLIAARRLGDNPHAAFRAISGLVVALFVTTVAVGILTTLDVQRGVTQGGLSRTEMSVDFGRDAPTAAPAGLVDELRSVPGVRAVFVSRQNPQPGFDSRYGPYFDLVPCSELTDRALGRCPAGVYAVSFARGAYIGPQMKPGPATVWPAASIDEATLDSLPISAIVAQTNGTTATLERVRTMFEAALPGSREQPRTDDDFAADTTNTMNGYRRLAYVVSLASLPIAGCSLAVSVAGALSERRRPFSLMRLTGVPLRLLRRVVALESAVPLLAVAAVAIALGLVAAQLFLKAQMGYALSPPGGGYYAIVAIGLGISLAIIASTLPLLERITGPESARNE